MRGMYTLRCGRGHEFESEGITTICPVCEERKQLGRRRFYRERYQRQEQINDMYGVPRSDREALCGACEMPLRGHSAYEVDDSTGERGRMCECGHLNPVEDGDSRGRFISGGALWRA